jgi:hypothetical protein
MKRNFQQRQQSGRDAAAQAVILASQPGLPFMSEPASQNKQE